jgi:hypothetical protein
MWSDCALPTGRLGVDKDPLARCIRFQNGTSACNPAPNAPGDHA